MPRFRSLVVDVDSTLCSIEGIDWLGARRDESLAAQVAEITHRAMAGDIPLADIYAARLDMVRPTRDEILELSKTYVSQIEPGAVEALERIRQAGVRIVLVTAGIRDAVLPVADAVGVDRADVNAVEVYFADSGDYTGFDTRSPMLGDGRKPAVVRALRLAPPIVALGDGITDLELRTVDPPAVDAFIAYTGVVAREPVVARADYVIGGFDQLAGIVLGVR